MRLSRISMKPTGLKTFVAAYLNLTTVRYTLQKNQNSHACEEGKKKGGSHVAGITSLSMRFKRRRRCVFQTLVIATEVIPHRVMLNII